MDTILIIDDDCNLRFGICDILTFEFPKLRVLEATNGHEALQIAETQIPDLILLDNNMPGMTGYETAHALKQLPQTQQTPVIALSGSNPHSPEASSFEQICDGWLPKPFTCDELFLTIETGHAKSVETEFETEKQYCSI